MTSSNKKFSPMTVTIVGLGIAVLGIILSLLTDSQGVIFTIIFFAFIIIVMFSSRWILTPTQFGHQNIFWKQLYLINRIKKIYVAKLPSDPGVLNTSLKMGNLVANLSGMPATEVTMEKAIKVFAPRQLWIDVSKDDGTIKSYPLDTFERNSKQFGRQKMIRKLSELAKLYPQLIDQSVYETEELRGVKQE